MGIGLHQGEAIEYVFYYTEYLVYVTIKMHLFLSERKKESRPLHFRWPSAVSSAWMHLCTALHVYY